MNTNTSKIASLFDREQIRDCIARVSRGEDRRDAAMLKSCYWPDSSVDHGIFLGSFVEYLAWVVPGASSIPVTLHTLGQSLVDLHGEKAAVETHVTAYHRIDMGGAEHDLVIGGRYLDRMERRNEEWRIARRTMLYDWLRDFGVSVDWSQGMLGMPFLTRHSIGSVHADHSEVFFKQESSASAG